METYESMRHFADSWGLLGMFIFFLLAVGSTLLPGARQSAIEAANIPLMDDPDPETADCCGNCAGNGPCRRLANLFEE